MESEQKTSKFKRVKKHIKNNKAGYIIGASAGAVVGLVAMRVYLAYYGVNYEQIIDARSNSFVTIFNGIKKSNITYQHVSPYGNKLGHPGNTVRCIETGKEFASQALAAAWAGVSDTKMSDHLHGRQSHMHGHHFEWV